MTLHTIVVHDPRVIVAWGIYPLRTYLVLLILHLNNSHTVQISSWSITLCNQICKSSVHPCKMMERCMQVISNRMGSLLRGSILSKRLYRVCVLTYTLYQLFISAVCGLGSERFGSWKNEKSTTPPGIVPQKAWATIKPLHSVPAAWNSIKGIFIYSIIPITPQNNMCNLC